MIPPPIESDVIEVKVALAEHAAAVAAFQRIMNYYDSLAHLDDVRHRMIEENLARYVNEQLGKAMLPVQEAVQNMWNHSELLATEESIKGMATIIGNALREHVDQLQKQFQLLSSRTEGVAYAMDDIEARLRAAGATLVDDMLPTKKKRPTIFGKKR